MALLSGELPGAEQVELDCAGDVGDAGLTWLAGGEVAAFLVLRGLARPGRSWVKKAGMRILARNVAKARRPAQGGKAATVAVAAARAYGKLIWSGGMPAASAAIPVSRLMAW